MQTYVVFAKNSPPTPGGSGARQYCKPMHQARSKKPAPGARLAPLTISKERWYAPWKNCDWEKTPKPGNTGEYAHTLRLQREKGEIDEKTLQEKLEIFTRHPDEAVAFSALLTPYAFFVYSQYLKEKAAGRPGSERYKEKIPKLATAEMELNAWAWGQTVKRAQRDLKNENVVLTPLAAGLIHGAHIATLAFFPEIAANDDANNRRFHPWLGEPTRTAAEAARYLGEEIGEMVKTFAAWTKDNATIQTSKQIADLDTGGYFERIIWENANFTAQIPRDWKSFTQGKQPTKLLEQLLTSAMCMAGYFQNPNADMRCAREIALATALRKTHLNPYPHYDPPMSAALKDHFIFEFSKAGGRLSSEQLQQVASTLKRPAIDPDEDGEKRAEDMEHLRAVILFPQACLLPDVRELAGKSTDITTLLRFAARGRQASGATPHSRPSAGATTYNDRRKRLCPKEPKTPRTQICHFSSPWPEVTMNSRENRRLKHWPRQRAR